MAAKGKVSVDQRKLFNLIRKTNSIMKKAIKPLGKPLVSKVKANAPRDTGALKASIGKKEWAKGGKAVAVIVGPRSKYQREIDGKVRRPIRYAHIVEEATHFLTDSISDQDRENLKNNVKELIARAVGGK